MRRILALAFIVGAASGVSAGGLDYGRRLEAHRAVERVLWAHRSWPESNRTPKPSLEEVLPESALRSRVDDVLRKSNALAALWKRPVGPRELQAEIDRIVRDSRDPAMLREMFDALGGDPELIGEVLARPALVDRLIRSWHSEGSFDAWWSLERGRHAARLPAPSVEEVPLRMPTGALSPPVSCTDDSWAKIGTGAPSPRAFHSTVWTGSEMIVWGGDDERNDVLNTGGRYNPATDTWSTVSTIGAPSRRVLAAAVWTGSRMIIWGGAGDDGQVYTGGRYDPVTDAWTPTSNVGAPTLYPFGRGIWTGSQLIVWSSSVGLGSPIPGSKYDPVADTWSPWTMTGAPVASIAGVPNAVWTGSSLVLWPGKRYDPVSDLWSPISAAGQPSDRSSPAMVWTGSKVIVWGGNASGGSGYRNDGGLYDPSTDTWSAMTTVNAPMGRDRFPAVWVAGRMVVWGGNNSGVFLDSGGRYDPSTNTWSPTTLAGAPSARWNPGAVATATEMVAWGGELPYPNLANTGGRYDPVTDSWVATSVGTPSPTSRSQHAAVWTGAEVMMWGGSSEYGYRGDGASYRPVTDSWIPFADANAPSPRAAHTAVWTGSLLLVWGGVDANGVVATGGRYDPTFEEWFPIATGGAPAARTDHTAVWTGSRMVVWGGSDLSNDLGSGGRYDPLSDTWTAVSTAGAPVPRSSHTAVWSGSEMIVWGGIGSGGYQATGGRYDANADTWISTTAVNAPLGRRSHSAVWTGSRMLVWGGWSGGALATGASYDPVGQSWTSLDGFSAPQARANSSTVWTGSEMIVWGGGDGASTFNSGARFSPAHNSWRTMSVPGAPRARAFSGGSSADGTTVIWGGTGSNGGAYNDGATYCSCLVWYPDADGDGYGSLSNTVTKCDGTRPAGYLGNTGDCNDGNPAVHPGVLDNTCDGIDDDCDGPVDEDYLVQPSVCGLGVCHAFGSMDCVNGHLQNSCVPGTPNSATDTACNTQDDDCDGPVDEDFPQTDDYWTATAVAPAARTNHTSVWSGAEMIVFGGDNGSGTVQTGGYAYDPSAGSWRTLPAGPAKRWHHTAVWAGSRMIVWGGDDNIATIYNNGSRYDPAANTWATTSATNAPAARGLHSAISTGSLMIVWGGRDAVSALNTGARYDPAANTWTATTTTGAAAARYSHTAVWTGTEMIVWGGRNAANAAIATGSRYNPSTNTWTAVATSGAPTARYGHVAVWTGTEMIVWGGTADGVTYHADGARYNPSTNTWTAMPGAGAPSRRAFAAYAFTGTDLLVWGGMYRTNEEPDTPLANGARYNAAGGTWAATMSSQLAPPSARARAQAVWTGTELLVWGGDPLGGALATGGRYNPRTLCGVGGCQQVGLTYCSAGSIGFQCTPLVASPEVCDNIDNNCNGVVDDGIPVPSVHPSLFASKTTGTVVYSWLAVANVTGYDVIRGELGPLRASSGNFAVAVNACLANDLRTESQPDALQPIPAEGYWYLVRPTNLCSGNGTYDDNAPPRDAEIAASGNTCP